MGALKFFILKYDAERDFVYNPEESISFEGETGPYVQYAHARICSIMRKYGKPLPKKVNCEVLSTSHEERVILLLSEFPERVEEAAEHYKPHIVANYLIELAQAFSEFYHTCPILQAEREVMEARLALVVSVKQVIANGLRLLGIEAPERM
jgi:arginyl-tRNA synthetase